MKKMRVGELATIYGINRQSIYKRIKKGEVPVTHIQQQVTEKETESYTLRLQVEMLEKQIKKLEENEIFLKDQITTKDQSIHLLQTLLSAPKPADVSIKKENTAQDQPELLSEPKITETSEDAREKQTDMELKRHRKGLLGRVLGAVFDS